MLSIPYTNDGSTDAPKLRFYLNEDNLADLREDSRWSAKLWPEAGDSLREDGFHGIQLTTSAPAQVAGFPHCALGRVNVADEADAVIGRHAGLGHTCLTLHAGWGIEDDETVDRIVEAILLASEKYRLPVYLETHRATLTQDIWRTVRLVERFPGIRFNGDFSHYYTGQEIVYGGLERKLDFLGPVLDRVAFMHARIGSPGNIQMAIGSGRERPPSAVGDINFLADFKAIWTRAFQGFRRNSRPGDYLIFCPELLSRKHYYARCFPGPDGRPVEESDRYAEALAYLEIARECWAAAEV
ncbi:MAG: hypothetical protein JJT96_15550 [Opitutales bacterium]|nr:hypothetical protein [Opitutales bacterium]